MHCILAPDFLNVNRQFIFFLEFWCIILMVKEMRMEYYINIMMENLDWGTLNVPFLDVEEISSGRDID